MTAFTARLRLFECCLPLSVWKDAPIHSQFLKTRERSGLLSGRRIRPLLMKRKTKSPLLSLDGNPIISRKCTTLSRRRSLSPTIADDVLLSQGFGQEVHAEEKGGGGRTVSTACFLFQSFSHCLTPLLLCCPMKRTSRVCSLFHHPMPDLTRSDGSWLCSPVCPALT